MNQIIAKTGSIIVTATVLLFAVCMLIPFYFGCYFVCMLLPVGYIMMTAGFCSESAGNHKAAAYAGMTFASVYTVLVLLVYFAQTTTVRLDPLNEQAMSILDYARGGLFFSYDLLGYGMLALSTFFVGLTINPKTKADKWLKCLMIIHGIFFFGCFMMPMTGVFSSMSNGGTSIGGVIALELWCAYFLPVGILACRHFSRGNK
ncbi:MAG: hypothetical protein K2O18_08525 [Oscillospiraceae bacterium]|nr:hypothetical protein [Oscillospiraceae bacterium]